MMERITTTLLVVFLLGGVASAMTCEEFCAARERGERYTIIDIRSSALFQNGHIAGAISVPFPVIAQKNLPELGNVLVYGDGIGLERIEEAVQLLGQKPGIQAVPLVGGYGRWAALGHPTTGKKGLNVDRGERLLLYSEFVRAVGSNPNLVIVDVRADSFGWDRIERDGGTPRRQPAPDGSTRPEPAPERNGEGDDLEPLEPKAQKVLRFQVGEKEYTVVDNEDGLASAMRRRLGGAEVETLELAPNELQTLEQTTSGDAAKVFVDTRKDPAKRFVPEVSLRGRYPAARILKAEFGELEEGPVKESLYQSMVGQFDRTQHRDIYVIVDRGHGVAADRMARRLRESGVRRIVLLAGGEHAIVHEGKPTTRRVGGGRP